MFENLSQDLKDLAESFVPYQEIHGFSYAKVLDDITHRGYFTNKCTNTPIEKNVPCSNMYRFCRDTLSLKRIVAFGGTTQSTRRFRTRKTLLLTKTDFEEITGFASEYHFKNHSMYDCPCRRAVFKADKNNILICKNKILGLFKLKMYVKLFIYIVN